MADTDKNNLYTSGDPMPNSLDYLSSYTYNITFSALPNSFHQSGILPLGVSKGTKKVIIAQTGVTTKFNIDNLDIQTVVDTYGLGTPDNSKGYSTKIAFTITEPIGASFFTLIQIAFNKLRLMDQESKFDVDKLYKNDKGKSKGPLDLPYLIEVDLVGYRDWSTDEKELVDTDGMPSQDYEILGSWAWPFWLTNFDFNPTTDGTEYNLAGVSFTEIGAKLPDYTKRAVEDMTITIEADPKQSATLTTERLLEKFAEMLTQKGIELDSPSGSKLSGFHSIAIGLGTQYGIKDKVPLEPADFKIDPKFHINGNKETDPVKDPSTIEGVEKLQVEHNIKKGTSIEQAIEDIMKKSAYFVDYVTDIKAIASEDNIIATKECNDAIWAPVIRSSVIKKPQADSLPTGTPAFNVSYILDLQLQAGATCNPENFSNDEKDKKKKAIDKWNIVKQYDYMFTGLNDQVLDVDLSFPTGQVFIFPAYGGIQPTYQDSKARQVDAKSLEKAREKTTTRLLQQAKAGKASTETLLNHFKELGSDLKSTVSSLGKNTRDAIKGVAEIQATASGVAGGIPGTTLSRRLPSSPIAIFNKIESVAKGTQVVDGLFADIQDFQSVLEDTAGDLAGGLNIAAGQIAQIITGASSPFEFTSGLADRLTSLSSGIDGLVDNVNQVIAGTGLSLSPDDIPGLGEAQTLIDEIAQFATAPPGFSGAPAINKNSFTFEMLEASSAPEHELTYLEEMDFSGVDPDAFDFSYTQVDGAPVGEDPNSNDVTPKQHYASTMLSYKKEGIPYLVQMELTVKGDPYWFGREDYSKNENSTPSILVTPEDKTAPNTWKEEYTTDRESKTSAPYGNGSVFTAFRYVFPKEYEHYADDFEQHTGIVDIKQIDPSYSGYYMITEVTHKFSGGQFRQLLKCIKNQKEPNHPVYADDDNESEDAAQDTGLEAPAEGSAPTLLDPRQALSNRLEQQFDGLGNPIGIQPGTEVSGTDQALSNGENIVGSLISGGRFR